MKPQEERAPRHGSVREVQKTHREFALKKRVGIGGHELGQRRMLRGVGSAMLTALRNFLTADEVVSTRTFPMSRSSWPLKPSSVQASQHHHDVDNLESGACHQRRPSYHWRVQRLLRL